MKGEVRTKRHTKREGDVKRHIEKMATYKPRREALEGTTSASTLILDL